MKIKCWNCGHEFDGGVSYDELGWHSYCEKCDTSFDVDKEVIMNKVYAIMFVNAIREIATKEDNLENLESYLSTHFDTWLERFANTPSGLASELKEFAEMEI